MKILLIGNGFDKAHALPTDYKDFLEFVENYKKPRTHKRIAKEYRKEFSEVVSDNLWIDYFTCIIRERENSIGERWIDFETEISNVIQKVDENNIEAINYEQKGINVDPQTISLVCHLDGIDYFDTILDLDSLTYPQLIFKLTDDLERLIRGLEIYISEYVNKIPLEKLPRITEIAPTHVLSFNYSNTYERVYTTKSLGNENVCYIHGKADVANLYSLHQTNMVLGIDEYLTDEEKDQDLTFVEFKKYYQRILKKTGAEYREWIDSAADQWALLKENDKQRVRKAVCHKKEDEVVEVHHLYIYGHSLDKTDGDVLKYLICNDNVITTIYYHSYEAFKSQIDNLITILGQEELIKRTGGNTRTIWFEAI